MVIAFLTLSDVRSCLPFRQMPPSSCLDDTKDRPFTGPVPWTSGKGMTGFSQRTFPWSQGDTHLLASFSAKGVTRYILFDSKQKVDDWNAFLGDGTFDYDLCTFDDVEKREFVLFAVRTDGRVATWAMTSRAAIGAIPVHVALNETATILPVDHRCKVRYTGNGQGVFELLDV